MTDWNGNGKMDPVDVGISIAVDEAKQDDGEQIKPVDEKKKGSASGCLTFLLAFAIAAVWLILM